MIARCTNTCACCCVVARVQDTAGEEKFDSLTNFYCRNATAALVCYDITSYETFTNLQRWVDKITLEAEKNCSLILVGNKCTTMSGAAERGESECECMHLTEERCEGVREE
jgi:small GTP-binding protein